ncbi:ATP-binding cassette domain-containing protein [Caballeronia fortuita]|uniref:ATP-binding cassette domain-containing protein n=1 Tax=Caballeronia fortuita TaxID=1777138 RepID=UPI0009ED8988|nr:ATP-binding cassette domain-containing protein [Caballeronia fortuita]
MLQPVAHSDRTPLRRAVPQQYRRADKRRHKDCGEQPVLNGFDLDIRSGDVVALLGPGGSGKSTLLRCINHLEEWQQGEIRVGRRRMGLSDNRRRMNPRERDAGSRRQLGRTWFDPQGRVHELREAFIFFRLSSNA